MPYVKVKENRVEKYPYSFTEFLEDYPNLSVGRGFDDYVMFEYGIRKVLETSPGSDFTKNYTEGIPEFIGANWVQTWIEEDASEEQIANRVFDQWISVRSQRNKLLLASDWTQLPDSPLDNIARNAWADYRQALRDITDQADPFSVVFPNAPQG